MFYYGYVFVQYTFIRSFLFTPWLWTQPLRFTKYQRHRHPTYRFSRWLKSSMYLNVSQCLFLSKAINWRKVWGMFEVHSWFALWDCACLNSRYAKIATLELVSWHFLAAIQICLCWPFRRLSPAWAQIHNEMMLKEVRELCRQTKSLTDWESSHQTTFPTSHWSTRLNTPQLAIPHGWASQPVLNSQSTRGWLKVCGYMWLCISFGCNNCSRLLTIVTNCN